MICLACGKEISQGIHLGGVGWLCNAGDCYREFNKHREIKRARELYGAEVKV